MSNSAPTADNPLPLIDPVAAGADPLIGTRLNKIEIVRPLDAGGMGTIYLGVNRELDKQYAIKVSTSEHDPDMKGRALGEAKALSKLDHPNIVQVFDAWTLEDGRLAIVMPLLSGQSLSRYIHEMPDGTSHPIPVHEAVLFALQLACGLGEAHRQGFVHRDLKPGNVFVTKREIELEGFRFPEVKLLDFGLVRTSLPQWKPIQLDEVAAGVSGGRTIACGTPEYVSPEQATGAGTIDGRSDLYSLGVLMFELLCGRLPFTAPKGLPPRDQVISLLNQHHTATPPRVVVWAGTVPRALEELIAQLLEKAPSARPQSARIVEERLRQILRDLRRESRWSALRRVALAVAAGVAVLAAVLWLGPWRDRDRPVERPARPPAETVAVQPTGPDATPPPLDASSPPPDPPLTGPPLELAGFWWEPAPLPEPSAELDEPPPPKTVARPPRLVAKRVPRPRAGEPCTPDDRWRKTMLENVRDLGRLARDDQQVYATFKSGETRLSQMIRKASSPAECAQANALFEDLRRAVPR